MMFRRLVSALLITSAACVATASLAAPVSVDGSVSYRERIAVPPGAVLDVEILDVSLADAPSVRMASQRFSIDHVPFDFTLTVDDALIADAHRYTAAAKILVDGKVLYRSTTAYPVLMADASGQVHITVERMPNEPSAATLQGAWQVTDLQGTPVTAKKPPTLTFQRDGGLSAFGGCNLFNGQADISGELVKFPAHMIGTMMACPEPISSLETQFIKALPDVVRFEQAGDLAVLFDASNTPVMVLIKG